MVDQKIFVIIDGSGSMSNVKHEVVKGINKFITETKDDVKGTSDTVRFSLTTFDTAVMQVYDNEDLEFVTPVTVGKTFLGGGTALLDAIGKTLTNAEDDAGARNIVVIYTDGEENSSREFTHQQISDLLDKLTATGNWQIVYLGAEFGDFAQDSGYRSLAGGSAVGTFTGLNTSKGNVSGTWDAVTATANYYRNASPDQVATISARGGLTSAAKEDANIDWDQIAENTASIQEPTS